MGLRVLPALLYGKGHSYGNSLTGSGTEESVAKLTREDLVKFHETWFRPTTAPSSWSATPPWRNSRRNSKSSSPAGRSDDVPAKNISRVQFPEKPVVYIMDRPGALQSDISGRPDRAARATVPIEIAIETMNTILGSATSARAST